MHELLSPRQVARAIDVSESSIKRWCDKGTIPTHYTEGGHRRIYLSTVMELVKSGKYPLVHPEALGIPASSGQSYRIIHRALEAYTAALLEGDAQKCWQIVLDLYLAKHRFEFIFDEVIGAAFQKIGDLWSCGEAEIYQERRGCEITHQLLHDFRKLLPEVSDNAPVAIGGTPEGDQYTLSTTMVELVLHNAGWNAMSLGENLPFETLVSAISHHNPRLFWLSCSYIENNEEFISEFQNFKNDISPEISVVIGGFALNAEIVEELKPDYYCQKMQDLIQVSNKVLKNQL